MFYLELPSERKERENLERRRKKEAERRERIFDQKVRTIGVDLDALELQIKEKKKQKEAEKEEQQKAYEDEMLRNTKVADLLHNRQMQQKQEMEKAMVDYRQQFQSHLNTRRRHSEPEEAQMMLPGLTGEDPDGPIRRQRQKEQLRGWLLQQQSERAQQRLRQKLEEQHEYQSRVENANRALQLMSLDEERRRAEAQANRESNLSEAAEKERRQKEALTEAKQVTNMNLFQGQLTGDEAPPTQDMIGGSGDEMRAAQERLKEFYRNQMEEKKRKELQRKQEEEQYERVRLDSARAALLLERQQARLDKQLRRHLDSANVRLAEIQQQQKPDIKRGNIDDRFFSQFNTCSR